jgi:hypothetical protein
MGGWSVQVLQTSGPIVQLTDLTIQIYPKCLDARKLQDRVDPWVHIKGVNESTADLPYPGAARGWYLFASHEGSPWFVDNGITKPLNTTTAPGLYPDDEFKTVENSTLIFVDYDGNGYLSPNDLLVVFSDFDADGTKDVRNGHCLMLNTGKDSVYKGKFI